MDLSGLKDVHVVTEGAFDWLPPAPLFWVLAAGIALGALLGRGYAGRLARKLAVARELNRIYNIRASAKRMEEWAKLAKRLMLTRSETLGGLHGDELSEWLCDHGVTSRGFAKALSEALYRETSSGVGRRMELQLMKNFARKVL